jgi:hypothetical protein
VDGLDEWLDRLKGPPHKCAAIFVDNSGIDIVLGILPFARELLQRGTKVIENAYGFSLNSFVRDSKNFRENYVQKFVKFLTL